MVNWWPQCLGRATPCFDRLCRLISHGNGSVGYLLEHSGIVLLGIRPLALVLLSIGIGVVHWCCWASVHCVVGCPLEHSGIVLLGIH